METQKLVKEILVKMKKGIEAELENDKLVTNGILDSLDIMNLIMELEGEFDIEIDPEDVLSENFDSVEAITALVEKCKS